MPCDMLRAKQCCESGLVQCEGGGVREAFPGRLAGEMPNTPQHPKSKKGRAQTIGLRAPKKGRPVAKEVPALPSGEGWLDTTAPNERLAHVWTIRKQLRGSHFNVVHRRVRLPRGAAFFSR